MEMSLRIEAINTYGCRSTRDGRMVYKILWYFFLSDIRSTQDKH